MQEHLTHSTLIITELVYIYIPLIVPVTRELVLHTVRNILYEDVLIYWRIMYLKCRSLYIYFHVIIYYISVYEYKLLTLFQIIFCLFCSLTLSHNALIDRLLSENYHIDHVYNSLIIVYVCHRSHQRCICWVI